MKVYREKAKEVSAFKYKSDQHNPDGRTPVTDLMGNEVAVSEGEYVVLHRLTGTVTVVPADVFEAIYEDTGTTDDEDVTEPVQQSTTNTGTPALAPEPVGTAVAETPATFVPPS